MNHTRIWLCQECGKELPRIEADLHSILNRIYTLKPCECGSNSWMATVAGKEPTP